MFHMLVGSPALDTSAPYEELARQIAEGTPRMRAEAIRTPLGHVVAKMLRRREAYRFGSAREVWAELRELDAWKQRSLFPVK
jgi:serine/threonine-protein kinase